MYCRHTEGLGATDMARRSVHPVVVQRHTPKVILLPKLRVKKNLIIASKI